MRITRETPAQEIDDIVLNARDHSTPYLLRLAVIAAKNHEQQVSARCASQVQRLSLRESAGYTENYVVPCSDEETVIYIPVTGAPESHSRLASLITHHVVYVQGVEVLGETAGPTA